MPKQTCMRMVSIDPKAVDMFNIYMHCSCFDNLCGTKKECDDAHERIPDEKVKQFWDSMEELQTNRRNAKLCTELKSAS